MVRFCTILVQPPKDLVGAVCIFVQFTMKSRSPKSAPSEIRKRRFRTRLPGRRKGLTMKGATGCFSSPFPLPT